MTVKYSCLCEACSFTELLHRKCSFCNFKSVSQFKLLKTMYLSLKKKKKKKVSEYQSI